MVHSNFFFQFCITVFMIYSHILFQSVYVINIFRLFKTATAAEAQSQFLLLRHTPQSSFGVFHVAIIAEVQRGFDSKQHTIHCYIVLQFSSISQASITFNHCQQIKFKKSRQSIKNARSTKFATQSWSFLLCVNNGLKEYLQFLSQEAFAHLILFHDIRLLDRRIKCA